MKYQKLDLGITPENFQMVNDKLVEVLVAEDRATFTDEQIYNAYSEKGGNHKLCFGEFDSFYAYSDAKRQIEQGQFFTPEDVIADIYTILKITDKDYICDPTAGKGGFINHCPNEAMFYANEIDRNAVRVMSRCFDKANIVCGDVRGYSPHISFDHIVGNPPFNLDFGKERSQYWFLKKCYDWLKFGAYTTFIVPDSFMKDTYINKTFIGEVNELFDFIFQYSLPRTSFNADIDTKVMCFQKRTEHLPHIPYEPVYSTYDQAKDLYERRQAARKKIGYKLNNTDHDKSYSFSLGLKPKDKHKDNKEFEFVKRKWLYEVRHQRPEKLQQCLEYIHKFETQKQPDGMKYEDYKKVMISKNKVVAYIKGFLKPHKKNKVDAEGNRIVYPCRKQKYYNGLKVPISDMVEDKSIGELLSVPMLCIKVIDTKTGEREETEKVLTPLQLLDTNKALQKPAIYLQWQQGCGKTVSSLFQIRYRMLQAGQCDYCVVISNATAINGTWIGELRDHGFKAIKPKKGEDISSIEPKTCLVLTFHDASKFRYELSRFTKKNHKRMMVIVDEADGMANMTSARTKAITGVFIKSRYKLLLSGTMTRNNINEAYPQLWFLYNSSNAMIDDCQYHYVVDKEDKEDKEPKRRENKNYGRPYKPYTLGQTEFQQCHSPLKQTVFGAEKNTQDVFNKESLKRILDYTVINRLFKEIVSPDLYTIEQVLCNFTSNEKAVYRSCIEDFHRLKAIYFDDKGRDARVNRMLEIIQQLNLLLRACSIPHTFETYHGDKEYSNKMVKCKSIIQGIFDGGSRGVAVGLTTKQSNGIYYRYLQKEFPEADIIMIDGDTPIGRRKEQIYDLDRGERNYIIVSTQQSLSCSLNIDFVDNVILPELNWNDASMSQYYFRFIRFTSTRKKRVIFVTYAYSIESNKLSLILNKEKLNLFMKGKEDDTEALNEQYGIDFDLIDMLLKKEKDDEGKMGIIWKESSFS